MLSFPIVGLVTELDMLLLGNRDIFPGEGMLLPFIKAYGRLRQRRCRVRICDTVHGPVYTLFFLLCPVLFFQEDGLAEYLHF